MKVSLYALILLYAVFSSSEAIRLKQPHSIKKPEGRVVGGELAEEGFAPYQVSLQQNAEHFCGGAIIGERHVLTASHCVYGREPADVAVVTGTNQWKKPGATHYVEKILMHCNYDNPPYHNDIAMLFLNDSIVWNGKTKPIALPFKPMEEGDPVILTGWGAIYFGGPSPNDLLKVTLAYLPHKKCKVLLMDDPDLDEGGHICTFTKTDEGPCYGDSGGPLVSDNKLVGLVNWGWPCAIGFPDAHASPLFYSDWIRSAIRGNSKCAL